MKTQNVFTGEIDPEHFPGKPTQNINYNRTNRKERSKMDIRSELGKRILFFDGGLGSLLQEKGLAAGELPEIWNITHPEISAG